MLFVTIYTHFSFCKQNCGTVLSQVCFERSESVAMKFVHAVPKTKYRPDLPGETVTNFLFWAAPLLNLQMAIVT